MRCRKLGGRRVLTVVRRLLHVVQGLVLLIILAAAALAWRLSQGPLDVTVLTKLFEEHATPHITVGHAALVWEGFHGGVDRSLDLRVDDMRATGADGSIVGVIPHATVSVSLSALLLGRIVWRAAELDRTSLRLLRDPDGSTRLDPGNPNEPAQVAAPAPPAATGSNVPAKDAKSGNPFANLLDALRRPPRRHDDTRFGELERLVIRDGTMTVIDRQLGLRWEATDVSLDLRRGAAGGVVGDGSLALTAGSQTARISMNATLAAAKGAATLGAASGAATLGAASGAATLGAASGDGTPSPAETAVHLAMTPIDLARLASLAGPASAALAAIDAPLGLTLDASLDARLAPTTATLALKIAAGSVHLQGADLPLREATAHVTFTPDSIALDEIKVAFGAVSHGPAPTLTMGGDASRRASAWRAAITLAIDHMAVDDLAAYWPPAVAPGARVWLTQNLSSGIAHDAHVEASLAGDTNTDTTSVTALSGGLDADDIAVHWLRPVPPTEGAHAHLTLVDPDTLEITATGGHQGRIAVTQASMRISDLTKKDQVGAIAIDVSGGVADTLALLAHPRLNLLSRKPLTFTNPSGALTGHLTVDLPLESKVSIEQIALRGHVKLTSLHLGNVAAGRALDDGVATLDVTNDGLTATGTAVVAHVPSQLSFSEDFRDGPPGQLVESAHVSGRVSDAALAANGVVPPFTASGGADVTLTYGEMRNRHARLAIDADLTPVRLSTPLGWSKEPGAAGHASATLLLSHGHLAGIEGVVADGPGMQVRSHVEVVNDEPVALDLDRVVLGRTEASGTLRFPTDDRDGWRVNLSGPSLDLAAFLKTPGKHEEAKPDQAKPEPARSGKAQADGDGTPYNVALRFQTVTLAGGVAVDHAALEASSDGRHLIRASLKAGGPAAVTASLTPIDGVRHLSVHAADAGALLRGLDVFADADGGAMTLEGVFDDRLATAPLQATAELGPFRVTNAPFVGRILQGLTLYGLVDALRGPGLHFSRLVLPFRYERRVLTLNDAHAFSPSLGLTAKGPIDLGARRYGVRGTIVPAYFFNTLLGRVPLVGRLFSPEKGGGVFAATYRVDGPLDDPQVSVNPLAALTPGALRGLFGLLP